MPFPLQVCYEQDIFNIGKEHPRRYVLSTGGEVDAGRGITSPGIALYHEGLDLIAIISTGDDVYELRVRGPLANRTWTNVGVRWEPFNSAGVSEHKGGLEVRRVPFPNKSLFLN